MKNIAKILFLGATMTLGTATIGTEMVGTTAHAEGGCDLDGYTVADECYYGSFGFTADKGDEEDPCRDFELLMEDDAGLFLVQNGRLPDWYNFYFDDIQNFEGFDSYTGGDTVPQQIIFEQWACVY